MNKLSPSQNEQIKEIGTCLRQKRLEKSLTLEDIAALTMIRLPMLQALEEGSIERLPELIYVKGFIRRYAEALKIDEQALISRLLPTPETPAADPLTLKKTKPTPTASSPPKENKASQTQAVVKSQPTASRINPFWIYLLLGAAGLLCGLWYFLFRSPTPETALQTPSPSPVITPQIKPSPIQTSLSPTSTNKNLASPQTPIPSISPVESPITAPTTESSPVPKNTSVSATVKLKDRAWLRVIVDGKTEYVGILETGEQKTWTAKKSLKIRTGNAGAVQLSVNEQPAKPMGKVGGVTEVTLSPDAVNTN